MSATVYLPDDRALFSIVEIIPTGQHVALCTALDKLVGDKLLRFPPEVADDVNRRADPEDDARLLIWINANRKSMDCVASHGAKRKAQGWAQQNGYPEGLDPGLGGRTGSCIVAVVAYLFELRDAGVDCHVVTDDHRPRPGRAPLGEVCGKLGVPTIEPSRFIPAVLTPLMSI